MIKKHLTKAILLALITTAIIAFNPIGVSAAWKQDSKGWWYTEGNSYVKNQWKLLDGNWYYFYYNGYMATNVVVDGYYINEKGAWSSDSQFNITIASAKEKAKQYLTNNGISVPKIVEVDHVEGNSWVVHCYSVISYPGEGSHTATTGWYYVDRDNGNIKSMF